MRFGPSAFLSRPRTAEEVLCEAGRYAARAVERLEPGEVLVVERSLTNDPYRLVTVTRGKAEASWE